MLGLQYSTYLKLCGHGCYVQHDEIPLSIMIEAENHQTKTPKLIIQTEPPPQPRVKLTRSSRFDKQDDSLHEFSDLSWGNFPAFKVAEHNF